MITQFKLFEETEYKYVNDLLKSVINNDLPSIRYILEKEPELINSVDNGGKLSINGKYYK
jgi:hypothetical protein